MTGAPEGSAESISGETGNRTWQAATPCLQGIAFIHYNTAVSRHSLP